MNDEEAGLLVPETFARAAETLDVLSRQLAEATEASFESAMRAALSRRASAAAGGESQAGRPLRRLAARLEAYEQRVAERAKAVGEQAAEQWRKRVPPGALRAQLVSATLSVASKYASGLDGGLRGMLRQALARSRVELTRDENELVYLLDRLQAHPATWLEPQSYPSPLAPLPSPPSTPSSSPSPLALTDCRRWRRRRRRRSRGATTQSRGRRCPSLSIALDT